jgi:hypothetical protein
MLPAPRAIGAAPPKFVNTNISASVLNFMLFLVQCMRRARLLHRCPQDSFATPRWMVSIRGEAQVVSDHLPLCRVDPRSKYVVKDHPTCTRRRRPTPCGQTDNRLSGQHNAQARHGCAGIRSAHDGQNSRSRGAATRRPSISRVTRPIIPDCLTGRQSSKQIDLREKLDEVAGADGTCEATEQGGGNSRRKSWREGPHPRGAAVRRPRFGH